MKQTQKEIVLKQLKENGFIDNVWCVNHYILRLGDIIFKLKQDGYTFDDQDSGYVNGTRNWRYVLKGFPQKFKTFVELVERDGQVIAITRKELVNA